jgi:hypothetical protein
VELGFEANGKGGDAMMQTIGKAARNERRKLTATYVSTLAGNVFLAGTLLPLLAILLSSEWMTQSTIVIHPGRLTLFLFAIGVTTFFSILAHWLARELLSEIED